MVETPCDERPAREIAVVPGRLLLVMAAESELRLSSNEVLRMDVPESVPRLLAFHDHAADIARAAPTSKFAPVVQELGGSSTAELSCRRWLLGGLIAPNAEFSRCAALWARSEAYQLVRFVLASPDLSVQQLANRYGLSPAHFRRVCVRVFGRPLKEQLRLIRASRALRLHADTGASFTDVAIETGFASPSHFCCEIKSLLGKSPSAIFGLPRRP